MALFNNLGKQRKDDRSSVVNSAKTLLANIRFMDVDNPVHTMAITSAVPNEGKTFVAANLASAIATSGKTCLLVECDMRRRSMSRALGVHAQHGIYAVMSGECTVQQAAVPTQTPNLYFLDSEPRIPNPSDLLNSNRFSKLVDLARNTYDYVLFDTPPVGTFVDAAVLGTKVDAVFMVVREGFTRKAEVAAAADQLKKSGCNLAGMIMNYCERTSSEYYYEYYYTHDDKSASQAPAPKMPAPKQRPARSSSAKAKASTPVPTAPPARRKAAPAGSQEAPVRQAPAAPNADDTGVYERLAEQASARPRRAAVADPDGNPGASPLPVTPYVPHSNYDEF